MNPKDDDRNTHLDRGDESDQLALVRKYFKFRHKYVPQQDRIEMLVDRIPLPEPVREVDFDLSEDGMRMLLVRGGTGGLGNPHFVTPLMPGPGIAMLGSEGETMTINLELKTIADAGLVGLPNAGKSSLLAAVSNAHPKIAAYAFTTLNPYVGTIEYADFWTMTIADMPGIIHDAHLNKGLGHRFLRHIERNRILVYVIDIAGPEPWKDFAVLQDELEAYKPGLSNRPSIIAANKADLEPARANLEILKSKTQLVIVPISAKEQKNIITLTSLMRTMLNSVK